MAQLKPRVASTTQNKKSRDNAIEVRDSISLISYANCLGPVIFGENLLFECTLQPEIAKDSLKTRYFGF